MDSGTAALRALLDTSDRRDGTAAAILLAPDVMYAVPQADQIETAPRLELHGRESVSAHIEAQRSPSQHRITACLGDHRVALTEGAVIDHVTGAAIGSFMASASFDDEGRVVRYVHFAGHPATAPARLVDGELAHGASETIDSYFHHLEVGNFEAAVDRFSADVVYAHPPYRHTGIDSQERVVFRGSEQLLAAFRARGVQSFRHRITARFQVGAVCLFEGVVVDLPVGGPGAFLSSATLDVDGRIARYVSFYCEPSPGGAP